MKKLSAFVLGLSMGVSINSYADNIAGDYQCLISPLGSSKQYSGDLRVTQTARMYVFEWQFSKKVHFKGLGLMSEDGRNIAVLSSQVEKPEEVSLTIFNITPEGNLKGRYFAKDSEAIGVEVCKNKPLKK